ncbi:MAG: sulfite exporter TauE/SafE family protein [Salaquimonas sp.]|jgi:hypothetical protein|nr:sulfite exporter TauE/SafE family protein [Salaquimonas sp.]
MSPDILFIAVAIPAVLLTGLSKGGFGGGMGMLATPLLAITTSPIRAAAIMLPILVLMDIVALISYRGRVNWHVIWQMIPGALVGIGIGWATALYVDENVFRIMVGLIAVIFAVNQFVADRLNRAAARESLVRANFWSTIAGYTSFVAHAGGPPFNAYALPLKLDKLIFAGTSVVFFAIVNAVKLVPYLALGQFSSENLHISALLMPVAIIGVLFGVWAVHRVSQAIFYNITYAAMLVIGIKLLYDGIIVLA